ncbi:AraC family transcriptional regulator [Roseimicrobium gellanilyticum]|uniref:AraC family transcriptional regulator n=1 Tax=Roseimicrobium gellanilyticum TaxID=748857 RepID=UPI000DE87027
MGEVAHEVGYASISAFSRAFQLEMGTLPSEYQSEHRPKDFPENFSFPRPPRKYIRRNPR